MTSSPKSILQWFLCFASAALIAACSGGDLTDTERLDDASMGHARQALDSPPNLALGKPTSQSSTSSGGDPARAVDGNTDGDYFHGSVTHTANEYQPWWQVDLQGSHFISSVAIFNRSDCCMERLQNFRVRVSNDGATWKDYPVSYTPLFQANITINRWARYVRIQLDGTNPLSLAEVQVFPGTTNLALGKPTSQSSTSSGGDPARAVDGNTNGDFSRSSVTHTDYQVQPWWQVDLKSSQFISSVVLYNRTDCCAERLQSFWVRVSDDGVTWQDYPFLSVAPQQSTFDINRSARYVRVQLSGTNYLSLAEVQVFSGPNLALGKPTSQSSTDFGGDPGRAADGNTDGNYFQGSVTATGYQSQPWWQVDLQGSPFISNVVVYNRTDCCAERLQNFRVRVSDDGATWQDYPFSGIAPQQSTFAINRSARYVRVQLNGANYLSLAEVQVFGADFRDTLAETFAPRLRFDTAGHGYPMSAQPFFDTVVLGGSTARLENTDPSTLGSGQLPTYYQVIECGAQLRIKYWWFYGYQATCDGVSGSHSGDWENVVVTLSENHAAIAAITFNMHGHTYTRLGARGGFFVEDSTHPVVYVGKTSHASHFEQGGSGDVCLPWEEYRNNGSGLHLDTWSNLVRIDRDSGSSSWTVSDRLGGFEWGPGGLGGISNHPTQNGPSCSMNAADWTWDVPTWWHSQCKRGDRDDGTSCHTQCRPGYTDMGLTCTNWSSGATYNQNIYGYDYWLPTTDVGLLLNDYN